MQTSSVRPSRISSGLEFALEGVEGLRDARMASNVARRHGWDDSLNSAGVRVPGETSPWFWESGKEDG